MAGLEDDVKAVLSGQPLERGGSTPVGGGSLEDDVKAVIQGAPAAKPARKIRPTLLGGEGAFATGVTDLGAGLARGMVEGAAGPVQLLTDAFDKLAGAVGVADPKLGQGFTAFINQWRQGNAEAFPDTATKDIGEFVGNILPYVAAPVGVTSAVGGIGKRLMAGAALGGGVGAAQFAPGEDPETRGGQRLENMALGGVGGLAGQALGEAATAGITKWVNSGKLQAAGKELAEAVDKYDPSLNRIRENVDTAITRSQTIVKSAKDTEVTYGNKVAPVLHLDALGEDLNGLMKRATDTVDPDSKVKSILKRTIDKVAPEGPPIPAEYEGWGEPARSQAIKLYKETQSKPPNLKYGDLREISDDIGQVLRERGERVLTDKQTALLGDAKASIDRELTAVRKQYPDLKALHKTSEKAEQHFSSLMDSDLRAIRNGDPFERAEAMTKIMSSKDPELAQRTADILGNKGKKDVTFIAVKKAMDEATDETGHIDPARFGHWFHENKASVDPFLDKQTRKLMTGMENLLTARALESGHTVADSRGMKYIPRYPWLAALGATVLNPGDAALHATKAAAATLGFKAFQKMLETETGRSFLAASSQVRPGTPRGIRIYNEVVKRFAAPTGGEEGPIPGLTNTSPGRE